VFKNYTPENTTILLVWEKKISDFQKDALKYIFNFDIFSYELTFAERDVCYTTTKSLIAATKTSTAGLLPLSFFSEKISKYLKYNEEPTDFIYVGRDDAKDRLLLNQDEVIQHLVDNGVPIKKVTLTGMPYINQVNLFKNAKFIMVIVGSGPTNQIHCNPNKTKILFVSPKNGPVGSVTYTAKAMNMEHATVYGCENFVPASGRTQSKNCDNFKLNKEEVLAAVQQLLTD
jgi:capsular polysaccharide biosynthesis protein